MTTATITRLETVATAKDPVRAWTPRVGRLTTSLLVLPAAIMMVAPFGLLGHAAATEPAVIAYLTGNPLSAAQLGVGLMISLLFCVLPFSRKVAHGPAIAIQYTAQSKPHIDVQARLEAAPAYQPLAA